MQILYAPPANGHLLADQILPRHDVAQTVKALPEDATVLMLEEDQYKTLVAALKTFPWAINNEDIALFIREIYESPKVNPNAG